MPILPSHYQAPWYLFNGHLQTIIPAVLNRPATNIYTRKRINTSDHDFLDLDLIKKGHDKLEVLTHGLEGSAHSTYMLSMASALSKAGYDVLSWNFRSCSGSLNLKSTFYHSGFTDDLDEVLKYIYSLNNYKEINLIGFSIGGNISLKYLGEQGEDINAKIKNAVVFSVPLDLESGAKELAKPSRRIYMQRFLKSFKTKFAEKEKLYPGTYNLSHFKTIKNFFEFDQLYTAPMYGFKDVYDYYAKASSRPYLPFIKIPTLIVNALNDPFLGENCFPKEEALVNPNLYLECPKQGGHVGFPLSNKENWAAIRALEFLQH